MQEREPIEPPKVKEPVEKTALQTKALKKEPIEPIETPKPQAAEKELLPHSSEKIAQNVDKKADKKRDRAIHDIEYKLQINTQNLQKFSHSKTESTQKSVETKIERAKNTETQEREKTQESQKPQERSNRPVEIVVNRLDTLESMLAFYEKESRYSLAIEIAQKYYDMGEHGNSLLWSKKANMLNREDYKAWLLYAKSEYARGNESKAIEILKLYLTNSTSSQIESQLLTWTKGK